MTMLYRCALGSLALALALALAACGDGDEVPLRPDAATDVEVVAMRASPNRDLDLLVVLDNSNSTLDIQLSLIDAFPDLLAILDTVDGGRPNLHIGVTTTDLGVTGSLAPDSPGTAIGSPGSGGCEGLGDDGKLRTASSVQGSYIADLANTDGTRTINYAGPITQAFRDVASVGSTGCGFEQPLRAIERALANRLDNAGFVRTSANFATIVVADEDDCSVRDARLLSESATELGPLQSFRCTAYGIECNEDISVPGTKTGCHARVDSPYVDAPQVYADLLHDLKPDSRMVLAATISAPATPFEVVLAAPPGSGGVSIPTLANNCPSSPTNASPVPADPGLRLAEFIDDLHSPTSLSLSICDADLRPQLTQIGRSLKKLIGDPCIDTASLADTSPTEPGIQPHCTAYDDIAGTRVVIPACADAFSTDCFELVTDEAACPYVADHLRVRVRRSFAPSADTWTYVRCAL